MFPSTSPQHNDSFIWQTFLFATSLSFTGDKAFTIGFWFMPIGASFRRNLSFTYFFLTASFGPCAEPTFEMFFSSHVYALSFFQKLLLTYPSETPLTLVIFWLVVRVLPNISTGISFILITKNHLLFLATLFRFAFDSEHKDKDVHKKVFSWLNFFQLERTSHHQDNHSIQLVEAKQN